MKVIAKERGFCGGRLREEGDTFNAEVKASWYEPVDGEAIETKDETKDTSSKVKPLKISEIPDPVVKQQRVEALNNLYEGLDPTNDDLWTTKGAPKISAINENNEGDDFYSADISAEMNREALLESLTNG